MSNRGGRLRYYLSYTIEKDEFLKSHWESLQIEERDSIINMLSDVEVISQDSRANLRLSAISAHLQLRLIASLVPERSFIYSATPKDWSLALDDRPRLKAAYRRNREDIQRLVEAVGNFTGGGSPVIMGGIKPIESIREKMFDKSTSTKMRFAQSDIWDLVRYRIAFERVSDVIKLSVALWGKYFDDIIRCRNYYFSPRGGNVEDWYRAIHFEIRDGNNDIFEVQIMTKTRLVVGLMDHAVKFKRRIPYADQGHKEWLENMAKASVLCDMKEEEGNWFRSIFVEGLMNK